MISSLGSSNTHRIETEDEEEDEGKGFGRFGYRHTCP